MHCGVSSGQKDTCTCWNVYFVIHSNADSPKWRSCAGLTCSSPTWESHMPAGSTSPSPSPSHRAAYYPSVSCWVPGLFLKIITFHLQSPRVWVTHAKTDRAAIFTCQNCYVNRNLIVSDSFLFSMCNMVSDKAYICSKTKMMQMCFLLYQKEHSCMSCTEILTSTLIFR